MPCSNIVIVILWCIITVMGDQESSWRKHNSLVSKDCFACKVPQPRFFYVQDLVEPSTWNSKYEHKKDRILPPATVLYRCDNAGYCANWDERCLSTSVQYVNIPFVIKPDRLLNQKKRTFDSFEVTHVNHTECACQKIVDNSIKK